MPSVLDISQSLMAAVRRLRAALTDPSALAKRLGALTLAASQKAFIDQGLGDIKWPERYPGQPAPFMNIAGALSDFNSGRSAPKQNRFSNRPALVDEGQRGGLWGSLTYTTQGPFVAMVGSNKPYASLHQSGGLSVQPITPGAKQRIRAWLWTAGGSVRRDRAPFVSKLKHLLRKNELVTRVNARPYLGITDQLAKDLLQATKEWFDRKAAGGRP